MNGVAHEGHSREAGGPADQGSVFPAILSPRTARPPCQRRVSPPGRSRGILGSAKPARWIRAARRKKGGSMRQGTSRMADYGDSSREDRIPFDAPGRICAPHPGARAREDVVLHRKPILLRIAREGVFEGVELLTKCRVRCPFGLLDQEDSAWLRDCVTDWMRLSSRSLKFFSWRSASLVVIVLLQTKRLSAAPTKAFRRLAVHEEVLEPLGNRADRDAGLSERAKAVLHELRRRLVLEHDSARRR